MGSKLAEPVLSGCGRGRTRYTGRIGVFSHNVGTAASGGFTRAAAVTRGLVMKAHVTGRCTAMPNVTLGASNELRCQGSRSAETVRRDVGYAINKIGGVECLR